MRKRSKRPTHPLLSLLKEDLESVEDLVFDLWLQEIRATHEMNEIRDDLDVGIRELVDDDLHGQKLIGTNVKVVPRVDREKTPRAAHRTRQKVADRSLDVGSHRVVHPLSPVDVRTASKTRDRDGSERIDIHSGLKLFDDLIGEGKILRLGPNVPEDLVVKLELKGNGKIAHTRVHKRIVEDEILRELTHQCCPDVNRRSHQKHRLVGVCRGGRDRSDRASHAVSDHGDAIRIGTPLLQSRHRVDRVRDKVIKGDATDVETVGLSGLDTQLRQTPLVGELGARATVDREDGHARVIGEECRNVVEGLDGPGACEAKRPVVWDGVWKEVGGEL